MVAHGTVKDTQCHCKDHTKSLSNSTVSLSGHIVIVKTHRAFVKALGHCEEHTVIMKVIHSHCEYTLSHCGGTYSHW